MVGTNLQKIRFRSNFFTILLDCVFLIFMRIPIEVFISHADEDKKIAREIAVQIKQNEGINVFVAHDDLEPGSNWKKDLTQKIFECDVFIPLLTKNFHSAEWTEQEVGIAHAFKKRMTPIRFDDTSTVGFMTDFQATKISYPLDEHEINNIVSTVIAYSDEGQRIVNNLIDQLYSSDSFYDANANARILFNTTKKFTPEQVNKIAQAYIMNNQISDGFVSGPRCLELFQKNWKKIDKEMREVLKSDLQHG